MTQPRRHASDLRGATKLAVVATTSILMSSQAVYEKLRSWLIA